MTRRRLKLALVAVGLVIELPIVAAPIVLHQIDREALKARIIAEVQHATGRALSVGSMRLHLLPDLTLDADDVALANPARFSRPAMLTARRVRVRVALVPLLWHRVTVREVTLSGADLKLEQPADQPPNWVFDAPRPSATLPHALPPMALPRWRLDAPVVLAVDADGVVAWQVPGMAGDVPLPKLQLREVNASSTISLTAQAVLSGMPVMVQGRFGGQNHLWNALDRSDWPVDAKLTSAAGAIAVDGTISRPRVLRGYDLTVNAAGADLGRLFAPWPALAVPRLTDLKVQTRVVDQPDGVDVPRLTLTAGASDLAATVPGLRLDRLSIAAPNIDGTNGTQANQVSAQGQYAGQQLTLEATLGPVGRLFGRGQVAARSPLPLDATASAAGAILQVQGRVQPTGDWDGTDATLHARIPDLAALGPLVRRALPALHGVALDGAVASTRGMLTLRDAHLTLPEAELRADGSARLGGRPRYTGHVTAARLDLDALLPKLRAMAAAPAPAAAPATDASAPATPGPSAWGIPDSALPLTMLRAADADVTLSGAAVRYRGADIAGLQVHLLLRDGRLDLDPVAARLGGGSVSGSLSVDAGATPPSFALELAAPGLDAATFATLFGGGGEAAGRLDVDAALAGRGDTPHALAATLDGYVGVAFTDGFVENGLLVRALSLITPAAQLGLALPGGGRSDVSCLATRLDLRGGVAVPRAFLLSTKRLRLAAAGGIDLGRETFALRLRPYIRIGGTGLVLPSKADGPWRDPTLTLEPANGAASAASLTADMLGGTSRLDDLMGSLGLPSDAALGMADSGDCAAALAAAHDTSGAALKMPDRPPPPPSRRERAIELLRRLFK